jgi:hypothetical protein
MLSNKSQIFSTDLIIAVIIFTAILITSAWFWDATKEKMHLSETRNDLELIAHNSVSVLINTVGDPPNWHNISFNNDNIYSIGIGKNRPWFIDLNKAKRLQELNSSEENYELIKKILGIRGLNYEFYLNISMFNKTDNSFYDISNVGIFPNSSSSHVISIKRTMLSDVDNSWVSFNMLVWTVCQGAQC